MMSVKSKHFLNGPDPGCYIELSKDHEWDNAMEALLLAIECFNFVEDCDGISKFAKNLARRYANLTYDLVDKIEEVYR